MDLALALLLVIGIWFILACLSSWLVWGPILRSAREADALMFAKREAKLSGEVRILRALERREQDPSAAGDRERVGLT